MHRVEPRGAREDAARRTRERGDKLELGRGELDWTVSGAYAHARNVERDVSGADDIASVGRSLRAPEHGADPSNELLGTEWLRHVVVRADLEAGDLVGLIAAPGQHDDRHGGVAAKCACDVEAIELR